MPHPLVARFGTTRAFTLIAPHVLPRCDLFVHRLSGGRLLPSRLFVEAIVLGTTGRRSKAPRATPLCAHRAADGTWMIVASNFGRPNHPSWSTNLLHAPRAMVTTQGHSWPVTARLLTPDEKEQQRPRILLALPVYDTYAARASRDIRVFCLTPATTVVPPEAAPPA
ncbi:deazaflavin-dependent oxidoreductase, nitroreductase family [Streptomyces noursei ATCC 11455]|uniref:nitroreductase family deazaflavin-dependent oxidoreductase n=1 Tax=Streptomyces noursei TaxID=1971 RepID=UPI00081C95D0|nr:deazaflavin-dependent oxidoreductase, nitroreductase family [Streptomyces noursei ATCC 11455]